MTSTMQSTRRPAGRGLVLLVLAVLAGVLAMHGLGQGPVPTQASTAAGGHVMAMAPEESVQQAVGGCSHTAGGRLGHADTTCAAAGVGATYTPPVLAAALDTRAVPAALPGSAARTPENGRAPPDLAELQLLRI
ncbi:DUF6153 family protein [Streptomyces sp. NBC_01167]|uniref:DUF6153 family protein n=1 Tax=Streptomyces sp. NBC_01167 TaxID=2903756 RepID=UPI0038631E95|nr:DUF6153 family protein [Streptomyces sp. NBC_01167]